MSSLDCMLQVGRQCQLCCFQLHSQDPAWSPAGWRLSIKCVDWWTNDLLSFWFQEVTYSNKAIQKGGWWHRHWELQVLGGLLDRPWSTAWIFQWLTLGFHFTENIGQEVTDVSDIWATSSHADFMESIWRSCNKVLQQIDQVDLSGSESQRKT